MTDDGATVRGGSGDGTLETLTSSSVRMPDAEEHARPSLPGYELLSVLGAGGMGVVWEAIEHRFERRVAVKVHKSAASSPEADLFTEALVAARIADPGIVRVLDVGSTLDGRPFYAMELVEGTDLSALVAEGPLAPHTAVAIAADIARAVASAHDHGIVHRDLKPKNVIVDPTGRARVLDFGIAVDLRRAAPPSGELAGSPPYMAPEQALLLPASPRTDVHAIGVVLHEMLTGQRPFAGSSVAELLASIVEDVPAPPSRLVPAVHADVDAIVARCLAKAPEDRFGSARALFEALRAVLEGRAVPSRSGTYAAPRRAVAMPPDRPRREEATKHLSWSWTLAASPGALWPYVADTDRFNQAAGMAPVAFTDEPLPGGGVVRSAESRVLGMAIRWREYPFEWVKDREHSVFRWYRSGPLSAMWNKVQLAPGPNGGTVLTHDVWLTPRGVLGSLATFLEVERRLGPAFDQIYRQLDAALARGARLEAYDAPHVPTPEQRAAVETGSLALREAGVAAPIVERIAMIVSTAPDRTVTSLRPFALAEAWDLDPGETLEAFLHAAHVGLLEPTWEIVCPKCQLAHESVAGLGGVRRIGTCAACATTFERDLLDHVELVFVPHPSLRKVERSTYCAGSPALRPHVLLQQVLDPGEERRVTLTLPRGRYRIASALAKQPFEIVASAVGFENTCAASSDAARVTGGPAVVRAGEVTFVLRNDGDREETLRVETSTGRADGVSAVTALTHPSFRAFFPEQLLAAGEHVRVRRMAFVHVQVDSHAALARGEDDAATTAELTRVQALVAREAAAHEGMIVPSSFDLHVLAFASKERAARAALALRDALASSAIDDLVAVAAHEGPCVALTRDAKPEFFGETLVRGRELLSDCPPRSIALSATFAADRHVALLVHEAGWRDAVLTASSGPYVGRRITTLRRVTPRP